MARLLVLWLLAEKPMTGYEIKKSLTDAGMSFWFGLEDGSIYSVLRTLVKHGHAEILRTEREGGRPTRTRYRITRSGRSAYRDLSIQALRTTTLPVAPIDVVLAARGDLDSSVVSEALADRTKALHELVSAIDDHRRSAPSRALVDRTLALVRAELDWLERLDHRAVT